MQDSNVCLGVGAKGRSSSQSLSRVAIQIATDILGRDLHPKGLHTPTWSLRADQPSRGRAVEDPRICIPWWVFALRSGVPARAQAADEYRNTLPAITRWVELEPYVPRTPLPETLLHAAMSIMLSWGWCRALTILWLAFYGLLRPAEACLLRRSEVMLRRSVDDDLYVHIRAPKRRSGAALREYTKIEGRDIHPLFLCVMRGPGASEKIWPSSPASLARRLQAALGAAIKTPRLYTLGSLRAGGATALFTRWREDLPRLLWRGRWRDARTLGHYVHELLASRIVLLWSPERQLAVEFFAGLAGSLLDDMAAEQCFCGLCEVLGERL